MKRICRYTGLLVLLVMAVITTNAQQKLQAQIGYSVNTPVGSSFKNFISKTSFRGVNGELTYPVNDQLNIGLGVSYNDFYQKYPRQVLATKFGDISAVVSNSVEVTPIVAKAKYSFLKEGLVRPYAGLGAGVNFINYSQYLGEFPDSKSVIKPAVQADAGINIPLNKTNRTGINLGANFNYLPFNYEDVKNLNNWGVHAGVIFQLK